MKTHLILPDSHAHPDYKNDRYDWVGKLILDLKPDVFVNIGDTADMASLSAYDKGKASFHGKNYGKDIEAHLEAQERLFGPIVKAKKKRPYSVILEGNHEHRLKKVLEYEPHLEGVRYGISFRDFDFQSRYSDVVEYDGGSPGVIDIDGISYAHYFVSGISGRALQSTHHGYALTQKRFSSSTCGHSHLFDYYINRDSSGNVRHGLVCGVYQDYVAPWAGKAQCNHWSSGVVIKRGVEDGKYDLQHISLEQLRREYGKA
jgi:Calcineurin-like phosphoesterase